MTTGLAPTTRTLAGPAPPLPWTSIMRPAIATIAQPVHEIGMAAAERLLSRIQGFDGPPETVVLRTAFMLRDSSGPVPAGGGVRATVVAPPVTNWDSPSA